MIRRECFRIVLSSCSYSTKICIILDVEFEQRHTIVMLIDYNDPFFNGKRFITLT